MGIAEIIKTINENINIIAIFLSPLIAVIIGELLRNRNFKKQKRLEVLYNLIAYRDKPESDQFLQSLNSLKLFFSEDNILKSLLNEMRIAFQKRDEGIINFTKPEQLISKIIKRTCDLEGFRNIAEEDINNLFKKK